jgi:hypothetical protein
VNPDYAASLRAIAAGGADALLTGPIAQDIVNKIKSHPTNPGIMEMSDFAAYTAKKRAPVCGTYRTRWRICGMDMPSSGPAAVLQTLGILQNFDVAALRPDSVEAVHLVSEAYRLAYADRAVYMADPDFVCVPTAGLVDLGYLRQRATIINLQRSMGVPVAGNPSGCGKVELAPQREEFSNGTSHVSIVDADGNALSMTTTVESAFGSHQWVRGFVLNNQLTDFSFTATDAQGRAIANRVEPGKRPRSSMAPVLVFDEDNGGRLYAVIGSPGGSNIIQYVAKTLVGILDWKLDIQSAIDLGNFGAQTTATTSIERNSSVKDLGPGLQALGHTVSVIDINSGIHGITRLGPRAPVSGGLAAIVKPLTGGRAEPIRAAKARRRATSGRNDEMKSLRILALAAATLAAPAFAQSWYAGVSAGAARSEVDSGRIDADLAGLGFLSSSTSSDTSGSTWRIFAGAHPAVARRRGVLRRSRQDEMGRHGDAAGHPLRAHRVEVLRCGRDREPLAAERLRLFAKAAWRAPTPTRASLPAASSRSRRAPPRSGRPRPCTDSARRTRSRRACCCGPSTTSTTRWAATRWAGASRSSRRPSGVVFPF